jgi:D-alanyl-D-alanine dipeptidase
MRIWKWLAAVLLTAMALAAPAGAQTLPGGFVYLRDLDPTIRQDIRYAGVNNFVGRPLEGYGAAECVVKRDVGLGLTRVQAELGSQNLSLKVLDCYRPERAVHDMVVWARNGQETPAERRYNPAFSKKDLFRLGYIAEHSGHSTGAAVDLTLVDLKADNSRAFDPDKAYADCTARGRPRARSQRRYGHRLRLFRPQGAYGGPVRHERPAPMAKSAGCCNGEARICKLCQGVVAFFAAGRGRSRV